MAGMLPPERERRSEPSTAPRAGARRTRAARRAGAPTRAPRERKSARSRLSFSPWALQGGSSRPSSSAGTPRELLDEGPHERDRAAAADRDRVAAVARGAARGARRRRRVPRARVFQPGDGGDRARVSTRTPSGGSLLQERDQAVAHALRVLPGRDAHADARARLGARAGSRRRRAACASSADHRERGPVPDALVDAERGVAREARRRPACPPRGGTPPRRRAGARAPRARRRRARARRPRGPGTAMRPRASTRRPSSTRERGRRVGHRSAPHAAVERVVERAHAHVDVHDAAQARRERRQARREVRGVGEHEHVAAQPLAVRAQELGRGGAEPISSSPSTISFTLSGSRRSASSHARSAASVEQDARLVVHDAAAVEAAVGAHASARRPGVSQRSRRPGGCTSWCA